MPTENRQGGNHVRNKNSLGNHRIAGNIAEMGVIEILVNENRFNQLFKVLEPLMGGLKSECPIGDDGEIIPVCPDCICSECWKQFITEPPATMETPIMIKLVSDQLIIDSELLK